MNKKKKEDFSFSKAISELEEINEWFENENTDLDKGLEKFKRALELIQKCKKTLNDTKNKIVSIKKEFEYINENE